MSTTPHDLSKLHIDRDPPAAVRRAFGRTVAIFAVAAVLVGVGALVLRGRSAVTVETTVATPLASGGGGVAPEAGATAVTANGYVVARTRASVAAKVPGRLATLTVDGGSFVRRGQVIAQLENADWAAAVAQAKANLASTRAELLEAASERDQAQREAGRIQRIRADNPDLMSEQDLEVAENRAATTAARAIGAKARIEAAQAALRVEQATLENSYIRAPFTGTVLRKEAEVGEVVAPSVGGGLTRGAVVTMADLSTLEVEVDVNEAYIGRVRHEQPARITLDAYPDTAFRGWVRQVVPTADRQRATVQVKVAIADKDARILPEMGARVDFLTPPRDTGTSGATVTPAPTSLRLPVSAVRDAGGQSVVWLVRDGRLESRAVEAGPASGGFREIRRGLSGGELVVTGGVETPTQGLRVKVRRSS